MCGQREYRLDVMLAGGVVPDECIWFASGPNVRVRLQKAKTGPYWGGLLANKRKMVQLKVDWASWLDEDPIQIAAQPSVVFGPGMRI